MGDGARLWSALVLLTALVASACGADNQLPPTSATASAQGTEDISAEIIATALADKEFNVVDISDDVSEPGVNSPLGLALKKQGSSFLFRVNLVLDNSESRSGGVPFLVLARPATNIQKQETIEVALFDPRGDPASGLPLSRFTFVVKPTEFEVREDS